jgi:acetylornithine deacetylase/succinyl-diaminopimelate desuccinylase-like protein
MLSLVLALVASLSPAAAAPPTSYEDMAVELLRQYLRIDTTNPPGNELKAALFFKDVLAGEGIAAEIDEFAPGRANLIATLKGSGARRPLVLASHMDVVPADPSRWSVPAFEATLKDGEIYGRGAEDMKPEGILHLMALIRAKREALPLERDLVFLGTADEEAGFTGAERALSPAGWRSRLAGAEYLITEGGENYAGADGKPLFFGIDTGEKGAFWLTLKTTGTPGHGSVPIADSALNRLVRALDRIRLHRTEMKVLPSVDRYFRDLAPRVEAPRSEWYHDVRKALRDPALAQRLYDDREVSALLRNTISITVVKAGYKTNVIPGTAEAELDVRLLPGEDPGKFLAELRAVIDDPTVEIENDNTFHAPNESRTDSDLFHAFESVLAQRYPGVPVTTKLLTGATECVLYRPLGIECYGFTPLIATPEQLSTGHGDDERIDEKTVRDSVAVFYDVIRTIAARR